MLIYNVIATCMPIGALIVRIYTNNIKQTCPDETDLSFQADSKV